MLKRLFAAAVAAGVALFAPAAFAQDKIRFAVSDVEGMEALQREYTPFAKALEEAIGAKIELFPVNSRTVGVEALAAKQVDFVLVGPAEYVVFANRAGAKPVAAWQRPDYFGQVVVLADGPIKKLEDLKGKTISFGEIGSTSQHLAPAQALADFGIKYNADYKAAFLKVNVAVEALQRGDIAAVGMNLTQIQRARQQFPGVKFKVLARGRDLPDDVLVAGPHVPDAVVAKVKTALTDKGADIMKAVISVKENAKFVGGGFLPGITDSDYDYVRSMYRTLGVNEFSKFITP